MRDGTVPTPTYGAWAGDAPHAHPGRGPQLSLCGERRQARRSLLRTPGSGPDPPWGPAREAGGGTGPRKAPRIAGHHTTPISSLAWPLFPRGGPLCLGGQLLPPPSPSLLSLGWAGRGGRQRYLFISFIYLIFFFFGVESDRWRRVPGEPALPQCRRMPITVSHVIAAARDVPSPYGLA